MTTTPDPTGPATRAVKYIIAAVDDSAAAHPVITLATALAPVLGATVQAVQVTDGPATAGQTARISADRFGLPLIALQGDPFEELVRLSQQDDVVALVLGSRSRPGGRRPAGHLALQLAGACDKPVVLVPPSSVPGSRVHTVLMALEGKPGRSRALLRAVELASGADLELVAVHVDDESSIPSFSDQVQHETEAYTHEFLARYLLGAPGARLELRIGDPAEEILAAADACAPDLIAVGWPHTDIEHRGETARGVVDRSTVPVLLIAVA